MKIINWFKGRTSKVFFSILSCHNDFGAISILETYNGELNFENGKYRCDEECELIVLTPSKSEIARIKYCDCRIGERIILFPDTEIKGVEIGLVDNIPKMIIGGGGFAGVTNVHILLASSRAIDEASYSEAGIPKIGLYGYDEFKTLIDTFREKSLIIEHAPFRD